MSAAPAGPGAPVTGRVGPPGGGDGGGGRRAWRPRRRALAALVLTLAAVAVVVFVTLGGGSTPPSRLDNGAPVSYYTLERQTITEQSDQSGTLGYSGSYTVSIPTGTAGSQLTQDLDALAQARSQVAAAKRTLAAARRLASPQSAGTLSAARATLASDRAGLAAARSQLTDDRGLGCPPSSSATVTTALGGSNSPSGANDNTGNDGSGDSPAANGYTPDAHAADGGSTGASGASAPSAQTGDVDGTSSSATTLTGSVDPDGADTSYYFEYGTSSAYGSATPSQDAGSGSSPVAVSATLSGLAAGTTYDYRLVAVSSQGPAYGQQASFTTTAGPGASTGSATAESTTVTFSGVVTPGGLSTSYYFEYGTTSAYGERTAVQTAGGDSGSVSVSASATGLEPNRTYVFALVASNSLGSSTGQPVTFQTLASSCAAQAQVVREDERAVAQAQDDLTVDRLGAGSTTSQDATELASDRQAL
ncbi:MAG TPA: hypothetical protein VL977_00670, partial [Solirubrobacteraceae bacterium]|nr:hypothetical protein [Solirubrobacteraceae bacterium]